MKISTKGRYAIRVMIDLAEHNTGEYIPLMDIAGRQEISEKYLESIVAVLSKNDLLISLRGKGWQDSHRSIGSVRSCGSQKVPLHRSHAWKRNRTTARVRLAARRFRCGKAFRK